MFRPFQRPPLMALGLVLGLAMMITACESPKQPPPTFPPLTFDGPPIRLDVADIQVRRLYRSDGTSPHVDHLFHTPPAEALEQWANQKLVAAGQSGTAVMTITQGAVLLTPLERKGGISGALTTEQSVRYDAEVGAVIDQFDAGGQRVGSASAAARKARSLDEEATERDKLVLWDSITRELMDEFNASMTGAVRTYLKPAP